MDTKYYEKINGDMFDFRDFYFAQALALPDNAVIAEVGVADGKSALYLAGALTELEKKFTLYMIDNMAYGGMDQMYTVIDNVVEAGMSGIRVRKWDSLEAAGKFPDVHFDMVFLDSSHLYDMTKQEIRAWYPRVKDDGVLAGHDYTTHEQVRRAVDEVVPKENTRTAIRTVNGEIQQRFKQEQVLHVTQTSKGYGVWWMQKKFYISLR
jgi:predicted O-methyltransferase YrrM